LLFAPRFRPLVHTLATRIEALAGLVETTQPAVVAIATYGGYNTADSVVVSREAVDRGLFQAVRRVVASIQLAPGSRIVASSSSSSNEDLKFRLLARCTTECDGAEPGVVRPHARVDLDGPRTALVRVEQRQVRADGSVHLVDASVCASEAHKWFGRVQSVRVTRDASTGEPRLVRIVFLQDKRLEVGDKLNTSHGQKMTVAAIVPREDLPFSPHSGLTPDMIVNPHCLPTRMTTSLLIENALGRAAAVTGKRFDASACRGDTLGRADALLRQAAEHGRLVYRGTERLRDGLTGELIHAPIYVGVVGVMRQKHLSSDKQSAARPSVARDILTRQPVAGRSVRGGIRNGEMERDMTLAHGAAALAHARFSSPDATCLCVCSGCGVPCGLGGCTDAACDGIGVETVLPYAVKLLHDHVTALGLSMQFRLPAEQCMTK
jgi:DNA-directed RNA polymerase beta subunit